MTLISPMLAIVSRLTEHSFVKQKSRLMLLGYHPSLDLLFDPLPNGSYICPSQPRRRGASKRMTTVYSGRVGNARMLAISQ